MTKVLLIRTQRSDQFLLMSPVLSCEQYIGRMEEATLLRHMRNRCLLNAAIDGPL